MDEKHSEFGIVLPSMAADLACTRKVMTVAQVAEALGYQSDTIQKVARALESQGKIARIEIRPDSSHALLLDESQVKAVKDALAPRTLTLKSKVDSAVTKLDMIEKARDVMAWLTSETERLRAELAIATPKCEGFDALMRSDQTMSITDAAKHFGLHPKTQVFPYLREHGYLTKADMPSQDSIDAGYLTVRETNCLDGTVRKQAVVLACQLDAWRTRVIPQINRWIREDIGE